MSTSRALMRFLNMQISPCAVFSLSIDSNPATRRPHYAKIRAMRACKAVIVMVLFAFPLVAHPVPFSYLDVQLQPGSMEVSLTAHIYDLAHDLQITPMERLLEPAFLAERQQAIHAMLAPRFGITADGHPFNLEWSEPEILPERQSVRFHLRQ